MTDSLNDLVRKAWSSSLETGKKACDLSLGFVEGFSLYYAVPFELPTVNRIVYHELMDPFSDWWNRGIPGGETPPSVEERQGLRLGGKIALLGDVVQCAAITYAAYAINPAFALIPLATNAVSMAYEGLSSHGWAARGELYRAPLIPVRIGGGQFAFKSNQFLDDRDAERLSGSRFVPLRG